MTSLELRLKRRAAGVKPEHMGVAHQDLVKSAQSCKAKLISSLQSGYRDYDVELNLLLDYQEYLEAADMIAGYYDRQRPAAQ